MPSRLSGLGIETIKSAARARTNDLPFSMLGRQAGGKIKHCLSAPACARYETWHLRGSTPSIGSVHNILTGEP